MSKEKRELAIPGEIIVEGKDYLPGDNTYKDGDKILAQRYGVIEDQNKVIKVIPISGVFNPRRGNVIVGVVRDVTFNGWLSDIGTAHSCFLPVASVPRYLDKNNLTDFLDIGEYFTAKIKSVKQKGIDLTLEGRGLGKLEGGIIVTINPNKVPRVIGKEGSMIKTIKDETNCKITVGQNGVVWIKGESVEEELLAKKSILFITERTLINGLTDKVKEFLEKEK